MVFLRSASVVVCVRRTVDISFPVDHKALIIFPSGIFGFLLWKLIFFFPVILGCTENNFCKSLFENFRSESMRAYMPSIMTIMMNLEKIGEWNGPADM